MEHSSSGGQFRFKTNDRHGLLVRQLAATAWGGKGRNANPPSKSMIDLLLAPASQPACLTQYAVIAQTDRCLLYLLHSTLGTVPHDPVSGPTRRVGVLSTATPTLIRAGLACELRPASNTTDPWRKRASYAARIRIQSEGPLDDDLIFPQSVRVPAWWRFVVPCT